MKIALFGHGKMGKRVESLAQTAGHEIVSLPDCDVCIDFSHPDAVLDHVKQASELKKNLVMGTTGWEKDYAFVQDHVQKHEVGFLFSPNFSLGVHLYLRVVEEAATLINAFDEYDIAGSEIHHNKKVDSPSGTARALAELLIEKIERKKRFVGNMEREIQPDELHFSSLRLGSNPGRHEVTFDAPFDTLTFTHQAKNRDGFATGAIRAAEWLKEKKGFYTMKDWMATYV